MEVQKYFVRFYIMVMLAGNLYFPSAGVPVFSLDSYSDCSNRNIPGSDPQERSVSVDDMSAKIIYLRNANDKSGLVLLSDSLKRSIAIYKPDSLTISEIYYYIGVCRLLADKYSDALEWFNLSVAFKEKLGIADAHYANSIYDIGVAYNYLADFPRVIDYMHRYIDISTGMSGYNTPDVAGAMATLISASLEKNDYESFRKYTEETLKILNINKSALQGTELARFYTNVGVGFARLADHAKAKIYFEEAESIYNNDSSLERDNSYINLINSLALTYGNLGMDSREKEYFERGLELAVTSNSFLAFNLINNFAIELGNSGMISKGKELISDLVNRAEIVYGSGSRYYIEALGYYAEYSREYLHDFQNSIRHYLLCLEYLEQHEEEVVLREPIVAGYAKSLLLNKEPEKALEVIQRLLFYNKADREQTGKYDNPDKSDLRADRRTLRTLRIKYEILRELYSSSGDQQLLESVAWTSELIISVIDKIRINISEEESRVILGDNYRDSYLLAICDFELCYRNTGEERFLEKVFEFAEKSKAAGLLAATRELNAVNFQIPHDISELEKSLQRSIAFYSSKISTENEKEIPDKKLIADLNNTLLESVKKRDSLVMTFERDYPGYYTIKYGTDVLSINDIPRVAGYNTNYINYIVSDSILYIIVVNRKYNKILQTEIDSVFFNKLSHFRTLLSNSDPSSNARKKFDSFRETGFDLYKILIEPVRSYFISDVLLISPDNILSYLPFETFLSSAYGGEEIMYRKLPYLMNDFSISYTYSASFMKETVRRDYGRTRNLIAFAPVYTREIYIDSLSVKRQAGREILYDLPFARMEAEYVTDISDGSLYVSDNARESVFKAEAGKYDIIHLAMHTYLNDQNPMTSAMIFSQDEDIPEDGLLNTYEVYGIPLRARMVVLSSCNTGSGTLSSGEGILSLARGFLYSGSQSVVMSMWEIEDRSGTDIVKMFYEDLLKGKSKSRALKNARSVYLTNASQLKSHPYFWSSLVVYGDNSPVYPRRIITLLSICILIITVPALYFLYRKYS